ncbi:MAG: cytochrome c [Gammaproteobacteria bacterium]
MKLGSAISFFSLLVLVAGTSASAEDVQGRAVYTKWCVPCHGRGPGHPGTTALAAVYQNTKPPALEDRMDLTVTAIKQSVRKGVLVMPYFRKTEISDTELDALAAYLAGGKAARK